jgi:hypothetical protein
MPRSRSDRTPTRQSLLERIVGSGRSGGRDSVSAPSEPAETHPGEPAEIDDSRIATLERRVQHLESALEGLQNAVHRKPADQDERITELRDRDQPPND